MLDSAASGKVERGPEIPFSTVSALNKLRLIDGGVPCSSAKKVRNWATEWENGSGNRRSVRTSKGLPNLNDPSTPSRKKESEIAIIRRRQKANVKLDEVED